MSENKNIINRNYFDNFSVKEHMMNNLIPKYFDDPNLLSYLNTGTFGIISEEIGNVTEDAFNTASVYLRESFPIRAQLEESIYTHAAIFQLDNFATTARCGFMLALDFDTVINNLETRSNGNYFYLDKDTRFVVEGISFVLDYDIEIKAIKRENYNDRYIFSAQYVLNEYENSVSNINNPYIPIVQAYVDGSPSIILPSLIGRQMERVVEEELIINNTVINFPTFDLTFEGDLAGLDVLYRTADEEEFHTQLQTKVIYSLPSKEPFCYYQIKDEHTVTISFTTRDTFFQPAFNSRIKVILYVTSGEEGNFVEYTGTDVQVVTRSDRYYYNNGCVIAARTLQGGSEGGTNMKSIDAMQSITVENFSTATALTTDTDLRVFFNNYHYRYGTDILFIKKRDDMRERLYGGFYVIKKGNYIYPTNTLHLSTNINIFEKTDTDAYILRPGTLFKYMDGSMDTVEIFNDETKVYNNYETYLAYIKENPYYYPEEDQADLPDYLRGPITYNKWKAENGITDYYTIHDEGMEAYEGISDFLYTNPFLIVYRRQPSMIGMYLTIADQVSTLDFKLQNERTFVQFVSYGFWMKRKLSTDPHYSTYEFETRIMPSVNVQDQFIQYFEDRTKTKENHLRVFVSVMDDTYECCSFEMIPNRIENGIYIFTATLTTDDYITSNSKLHLINDDNTIINTGRYNEVYVPICDNVFRIYTLYNQYIEEKPIIDYNVYSELLEPTFKSKLEELKDYLVTNVYSTETNKMYFVKPLNLLRNTLTFSDYTKEGIEVGDCLIRALPFLKYDIMQDEEKFSYFLNEFLTQYLNVDIIVKERLRNTTYIDLKFYNTYGKSKNFIIGDQSTYIDTVNLKIQFDIWLVAGTNFLLAKNELKAAIKDYIENINKESGANLYISNLSNYIETEFAYVDHTRFLGINDYDTYYQTVTNLTEDIDTLTRDERRWYVPELLNIEEANIRLNMMTVG